MRIARSLIVFGSLVLVAALAAPAAAQAPPAKTQWKMQSSWPAADFHQVNPKGLVEKIAEMTVRSSRRSRCSTR
jgi:TRAP-type mannitol/chloroaromatic compound transport system substrate-binding protein